MIIFCHLSLSRSSSTVIKLNLLKNFNCFAQKYGLFTLWFPVVKIKALSNKLLSGYLKMFQNTPESENGSIECFQNYTASEVFVQGLAGMVDQQDVEAMIRAQKQMLQRFEKTNEMLTNCNALSSNRFKLASADFKKHINMLLGMKKDLNYIFKKIKIIKERLATNYPTAYEEAHKVVQVIVEENEEKKSEDTDKKAESIPEFATSSSDDATNSKDDSSPCSTDTG